MTQPLPQRIVPFHDDEIIAVQQPEGSIFVLFGKLCDNLGLTRTAQVRRAQRHAVLNDGLCMLQVETEGGPQTVQCLQLDLLPSWLSGLQAGRVKASLQEKLIRYQREAAFVLWEAFRPQIVVDDHLPASTDQAIQELQQIAEMGRAIVRMAEQQIELQRQQHALATRIDTAAYVIRDVQGQLSDVQVRLGVLEDQLHPSGWVSEAQATEISNRVKLLGELLTAQHKGKNQYQAIFTELYRRFGASSYKLIRQEQFDSVLAFLEDWRKAAVGDG